MASVAKPITMPKAAAPLPAPNVDFYELAETLPAEEQAVLKQVRTFMETKVAPIITSIGWKTHSHLNCCLRLRNSTLAALAGRATGAEAVADC